MANPQPQSGQQPAQHTQLQAERALQQHAAALGLPSLNWNALLMVFFQLLQEALHQGGGGVQPQASPPNQP